MVGVSAALLAAMIGTGCLAGAAGDDVTEDPGAGAASQGGASGTGSDTNTLFGGGTASGSGGAGTGAGTGGTSPSQPDGGAGGAPSADVDCSGIDQNAGYELCEVSPDHCAGVFTNGAGCVAFCAAAGLQCVARYGGEPGCQQEATQLGCSDQNGHQSDWCVCGPAPDPDPNCTTDPQNPPAQVTKHYSSATYAPRSSWVLDCRDYAYTAQYAEHEACDSQYAAGSGKGTATFLFDVHPGTYDVFIEGRHTPNRNPAGARVEVNSGTDSHVAFIMQRDSSSQLQQDLHGTYCLSGTVEVVVDSSVSSQSDSVSRVLLVPASP
jgi:hypothetical protein